MNKTIILFCVLVVCSNFSYLYTSNNIEEEIAQCIEKNQDTRLHSLLEKSKNTNNQPTQTQLNNWLLTASYNPQKNHKIIKKLITLGASCNASDIIGGWTPFHWIVTKHPEAKTEDLEDFRLLMQFLVKKGGNLFQKNKMRNKATDFLLFTNQKPSLRLIEKLSIFFPLKKNRGLYPCNIFFKEQFLTILARALKYPKLLNKRPLDKQSSLVNRFICAIRPQKNWTWNFQEEILSLTDSEKEIFQENCIGSFENWYLTFFGFHRETKDYCYFLKNLKKSLRSSQKKSFDIKIFFI